MRYSDKNQASVRVLRAQRTFGLEFWEGKQNEYGGFPDSFGKHKTVFRRRSFFENCGAFFIDILRAFPQIRRPAAAVPQ